MPTEVVLQAHLMVTLQLVPLSKEVIMTQLWWWFVCTILLTFSWQVAGVKDMAAPDGLLRLCEPGDHTACRDNCDQLRRQPTASALGLLLLLVLRGRSS